MNKEQQALNTLREKGYTNHFQPIKLEQQYPNEFKTLQELVDQQSNPTLLECIKEWNEKGFDVDIYAVEIVITGSTVNLTIDLEDKTLFTEGECNSFSYDVVHLLSKTLKALEVVNDR